MSDVPRLLFGLLTITNVSFRAAIVAYTLCASVVHTFILQDYA